MLIKWDLYPTHQVDAELSDSDNDGQNEPTGDDARCQGVPSTESIAPNPIGSSMAEQIHPYAVDQTTTIIPTGSGQQKKKCVVLASKIKQPTSSDQVITELPPYRGPRSSLDLVVVEFFSAYLKLFDTLLRPLGPEHRLRLTPSQPKNLKRRR
jgi:hypothetical protein